jgi:hypothetical protein
MFTTPISTQLINLDSPSKTLQTKKRFGSDPNSIEQVQRNSESEFNYTEEEDQRSNEEQESETSDFESSFSKINIDQISISVKNTNCQNLNLVSFLY